MRGMASLLAVAVAMMAGCAHGSGGTSDADASNFDAVAADAGADAHRDAGLGDGQAQRDGQVADGASVDAFVPTVSVPMSEALLVYARNHYDADTDESALAPYLAYVDQQGHVLESYLYDTFVYLDIDLIVAEDPTVEAWRHFLDTFFDSDPPAGYNVRPETTQRSGVQGALLDDSHLSVTQTAIPVSGGGTYSWEVFTRCSAEVTGREALIGVVVRDAQQNPITTGVTGLTWSDYVSEWYHYLPSTARWSRHRGTFTLPANAVSLDVQFRKFTAQGEQVSVDRAQLVAGSSVLPFESAVAADYDTLFADGDFNDGAAWQGLVAGDGLERAFHVAESKQAVAQGPIAVSGGATYTLAAALRRDQSGSSHAALLGIRIFDSVGAEITTGVTGMSYSTAARPNMFYAYGEATTSWGTAQATFTLPVQAASLDVYLVNWAGDGVWFDQVQLVTGAAPWSQSHLKSAGYETLIKDGSAERWDAADWWMPGNQVLPSGSGLLPALSRVASGLHDRRKRNVILGLPVGMGFDTQTDFGEVNGQPVDLTQPAGRQAALSWFIDEAASRWNASPVPGIDFVGFYWMHESRNQDATLAAYIQGLVESRGLILTGSPYRAFMGGSSCFGSSFSPEFASHFHRVWQQPNVWPPGRWSMTEAVWNNVHGCLCDSVTLDEFLNQVGYPPCELAVVGHFIDQMQTDCNTFSSTAHVHVNIEWVSGLEATQGYGRVLDYMNTKGTLAHDFGRFADRMWYEDAGFGRQCALSSDSVFRAEYDAVHDFIEANHARHGFPGPTL
ncbi:MAG: DUF4855 domain-containing protein [Deltaproteobacteria bacterium]|nr:DUF4855 domain-containing protein [Deltaproteobacteria bacterium]